MPHSENKAHWDHMAAQLQASIEKLQGSVDKLSRRLDSTDDRVGWEEFQRVVMARLAALEAPTATRSRITEAVASALLTAAVLGAGTLIWQAVVLRPAQGATPRPAIIGPPTPAPGGRP